MTIGSSKPKLRVLDLFSGIGGFSLGLERAGMQTVAFCEIDPFCRRVLSKHWPGVPTTKILPSLAAPTLGQLTLFAEDFPAKISRSQADVLGLKESAAAYGRNTLELLAKYDQVLSSWKTQQACLVSGWQEFSETWPVSGMMRSGIAYQLPPLALPISATASGLLPTLTARDFKSDSCSPEFRAKRDAMTMGKTLPWVLGGLLNPKFCEWFMGFPEGWTELEASETPSSRKSQKSSGEQS